MALLRTILRLVRQAGAPTESASERDGFLSYSAETHAIGHGLYHGLTSRPWRFRAGEHPDNPDVQAEPHYYKGAFVAGTLAQWAILLTVGGQTGIVPA